MNHIKFLWGHYLALMTLIIILAVPIYLIYRFFMNSFGNEVKMTRSNYNLSKEEVTKLKLKLYPKGTVIFPKNSRHY